MQGGETHIKNLKSQRWAMLTNEHAGPVGGMMPFAELEIMEHSFLIDTIAAERGVPRFTEGQMKQCYKRFRRFCRDQWDNRN